MATSYPFRRFFRRRLVGLLMLFAFFGVLYATGSIVLNKEATRVSGKPASLYFVVPRSKSLLVNQEYSLELHVDTKGNTINAVQTVVKINPAEIQILGISTQSSFCSFYLENSFDTIKGEVHLACGSPTPGFSGDNTLVVIQIRPRQAGTFHVGVDPSSTSVLANDGKGTELLQDMPSFNLTVNPTF